MISGHITTHRKFRSRRAQGGPQGPDRQWPSGAHKGPANKGPRGPKGAHKSQASKGPGALTRGRRTRAPESPQGPGPEMRRRFIQRNTINRVSAF